MPQSIAISTALQVINEEIDARIDLAKSLGNSSSIFTLTNVKAALELRLKALAETHTLEFSVGQAVKHNNRRGVIESFERDWRVAVVKDDDTGGMSAVLVAELQPVSIKKTDGVEGKNFID